ncbi:MAG: FtsK/SpoIIIE domain-containing protein [Anaerolineae bacterium]|nr:FtsK/SpoIIIE domain-containing protein [Anaerolineae bacterium]MDW8173322.1 FtsK/SpoIIIE domain-containing protein [Anaerolineae bacterium]
MNDLRNGENIVPELYSRMDNANWLTPSVAEILEQGATPPGGDGSIREHMLTIQRELTDLETPARIINVRSMPSYTLYVARPETIGRLGSRRTITAAEIKKSLAKIAENHPDWTLGFMPKIADDEDALGILLRTNAHRPLSLRRLLVRNHYRNMPTYTSVPFGITLEQILIVRDLAALGHVLLIGVESNRQNFIRSLVLTLLLLNTPAELRLALLGKSAEAYRAFTNAPHALGRWLNEAEHGQRLLDGLQKEITRRQKLFEEHNVADIRAFNRLQQEANRPESPRILLIIDSLSDADWSQSADSWLPAMLKIVKHGEACGIHVVATIQSQDEHGELQAAVKARVVGRQVARERSEKLPNFHPSLLRFIDAFWSEREGELIPIEFPTVTIAEVSKTVEYWQQNANQRLQENASSTISGTTGVTGVLTPPPTPPKPSTDDLTRAAAALGSTKPEQPLILAEPSQEATTALKQARSLAAYLG